MKMKKLSGTFRNTQWDPSLIIAQIISVQCIMYLSLGLIVTLLGFLSGDNRSLDHIFEYHVSSKINVLFSCSDVSFSGNTSTRYSW